MDFSICLFTALFIVILYKSVTFAYKIIVRFIAYTKMESVAHVYNFDVLIKNFGEAVKELNIQVTAQRSMLGLFDERIARLEKIIQERQ